MLLSTVKSKCYILPYMFVNYHPQMNLLIPTERYKNELTRKCTCTDLQAQPEVITNLKYSIFY